MHTTVPTKRAMPIRCRYSYSTNFSEKDRYNLAGQWNIIVYFDTLENQTQVAQQLNTKGNKSDDVTDSEATFRLQS